MDVKQFNELIVIPTLKGIGLYSQSAAELVLGTAVYESGGLKYIKQLGKGPALGVCQMEPATHNDIWDNYLCYKYDLAANILLQSGMDMRKYSENSFIKPYSDVLIYNLRYAVAMCRVHYRRRKEALPEAGDYANQAVYYKKYYNTDLGKGKISGYLRAYQKWVLNAA